MKPWPYKCQQLYDKVQFYARRMLNNPATADADEAQLVSTINEISKYLQEQKALNSRICKCCGEPKCS